MTGGPTLPQKRSLVTEIPGPESLVRLEQGVVTLTCGTWGNVLRFLPPLAISDELLHEGLDVVAEAFDATA